MRGCVWCQWNFFEGSMHFPISWWVVFECTCPHRSECSAVFDNKTAWPLPWPAPFIYPISHWVTFLCLFPWVKKGLKRKPFADAVEVKQKMAEALEGIKIDEFKNCFEQWKQRLHRCITSNGEYFEGDWTKHNFLYINYFFGGVPPYKGKVLNNS